MGSQVALHNNVWRHWFAVNCCQIFFAYLFDSFKTNRRRTPSPRVRRVNTSIAKANKQIYIRMNKMIYLARSDIAFIPVFPINFRSRYISRYVSRLEVASIKHQFTEFIYSFRLASILFLSVRLRTSTHVAQSGDDAPPIFLSNAVARTEKNLIPLSVFLFPVERIQLSRVYALHVECGMCGLSRM